MKRSLHHAKDRNKPPSPGKGRRRDVPENSIPVLQTALVQYHLTGRKVDAMHVHQTRLPFVQRKSVPHRESAHLLPAGELAFRHRRLTAPARPLKDQRGRDHSSRRRPGPGDTAVFTVALPASPVVGACRVVDYGSVIVASQRAHPNAELAFNGCQVEQQFAVRGQPPLILFWFCEEKVQRDARHGSFGVLVHICECNIAFAKFGIRS